MRRLPRNFHAVDHHDASAPPHRFVLFPARTVLPFLRVPLGYNIVHPSFAITAALCLSFLPLVFWALYIGFTGKRAPDNLGHIPLIVFAVAGLLVSSAVFAKRALSQRRGAEIHTSEAGYSHLTWRTKLPVMLCEQIIIPAGLALVGWTIAHTFSFELGWWLVICGVSYLVMARWEYTRRLAQTRMTVDDMIRAQTFEERLDGHERKVGRQTARQAGSRTQGARTLTDEPDLVELGGDEMLPAHPPGSAAWIGDGGGAAPRSTGWLGGLRQLGRR